MDDSRLQSVLAAQLAVVVADATLTTLLGGQHVYERMSSELVQRIPSVQYYVVDEGLEEGHESALIRWEVWGARLNVVLPIQRRLRLLLHNERPITLAGAQVISEFVTAYDAPDTAQPSVRRRVVETRTSIVRQRAVI